jgi:hypothetical protein
MIMFVSVLALTFGMSLFGGAPHDVGKDITVFNDTRRPVEFSMDGGPSRALAPGDAAGGDLSDFGPHRFFVNVEGFEPMTARYDVGRAEGLFQAPDRYHFCIAVRLKRVDLMASQECYVRLRRLHRG